MSNSLRPHLYSPWNSPGQNTEVGSHSLLQGIFPTQGSNPSPPDCRWILYQLSRQGSPFYTGWCIHVSAFLPVHPTLSPFPSVFTYLFSMSLFPFLSCKQVHLYHFSRFRVCVLIYHICFSLSDFTLYDRLQVYPRHYKWSNFAPFHWRLILNWNTLLVSGLVGLIVLLKSPQQLYESVLSPTLSMKRRKFGELIGGVQAHSARDLRAGLQPRSAGPQTRVCKTFFSHQTSVFSNLCSHRPSFALKGDI